MRKPIKLVPLATALIALAPTAHATPSVPTDPSHTSQLEKHSMDIGAPNFFYSIGADLMGLVTSQQPDGTILATHYSHSSHSSHSSHASHYSRR